MSKTYTDKDSEAAADEERNRKAGVAHERFVKTAVREGLVIQDVFGRLDGESNVRREKPTLRCSSSKRR